ncbi:MULTISPECIES: hypothetical protein [Clostridia]|uniref:hypothetical protein n=1 Tax=Clostridia TaxID=186801 RepID=UPI00067EA648|nr:MULTISPECIES: hypothetical protein [Clostridia]
MATQEKKEVLSQNEVEVPMVEIGQPGIEKLIYVIYFKHERKWIWWTKNFTLCLYRTGNIHACQCTS